MTDNSVNDKMLRCSAKRGGNKAILVAGPTASGKSGIAAALAREINGVVVNADSMQVQSGKDLHARQTRLRQRLSI